jgi:hypothetical protein
LWMLAKNTDYTILASAPPSSSPPPQLKAKPSSLTIPFTPPKPLTPPPLLPPPPQLKAEQEARLRARETKLARLARSAKRQADSGEGAGGAGDLKLKLRLFVAGLLDECPRCGEAPGCAPEDREAHRAHLRACRKEEGKARAYKEKVAAAEVGG